MKMQELRLNDTERYKKFVALKIIGVTVERVNKKLVISIENYPNADKYMDTTFDTVDDILMAFKDEFMKQKIKLAA
jgi:hypothetical protein